MSQSRPPEDKPPQHSSDNQSYQQEGNDNQVVQGIKNIVVQIKNGSIFNATLNFFSKQESRQEKIARFRSNLLDAVHQQVESLKEIKKQLNPYHHENINLINLNKETQWEQIESSRNEHRSIDTWLESDEESDESIIEFFEQNRRLLILGEPGSGKTVTLLQLAKYLLTRAKDDSKHPIPIFLKLSSWQDDNQTIAQWLVEQLRKEGVDKNIGKKWLKEKQLIPLFDGLDELPFERQKNCIQALNYFLESEEQSTSLVICCRTEDYLLNQGKNPKKTEKETDETEKETDELEKDIDEKKQGINKLKLDNAICLQPLTEIQIKQYLKRIGKEKLWDDLLQKDSKVLKLANQQGILVQSDSFIGLMKTPLFLTLTASTHNISFTDWQKCNSTEERKNYLFKAYIDGKLSGKNEKQSSLIKRWLSWLAQKFKQSYQTDFLIEQIQPSWFLTRDRERNYHILTRVIISLIVGLICSLIVGTAVLAINKNDIKMVLLAYLYGGVFCSVMAWISYDSSNNIETLERLQWEFSEAKLLIYSFPFSPLFGVVFSWIESEPLTYSILVTVTTCKQEHLDLQTRQIWNHNICK